MFRPKQQIAYVPHHANGDLEHPDVEFGFVTSTRTTSDGRETVFCRYWSKHDQGRLRTSANSEGADIENIVAHDSVPDARVEWAIDFYDIPIQQ